MLDAWIALPLPSKSHVSDRSEWAWETSATPPLLRPFCALMEKKGIMITLFPMLCKGWAVPVGGRQVKVLFTALICYLSSDRPSVSNN
ncbi:unnamed protein product [Fusarium graminearum]|uniref:Chromosome 3, complete genome n=1 Tax=Gibberella zeae (strain ATCC MYA-4620 / CBS 123657 / FGSC 9075 / NRRL 31084 / PH-1) TaxID=229533 RepID=A0A098E526_GIBZE|nr:unnamed protein product [Fusarium graminearum]